MNIPESYQVPQDLACCNILRSILEIIFKSSKSAMTKNFLCWLEPFLTWPSAKFHGAVRLHRARLSCFSFLQRSLKENVASEHRYCWVVWRAVREVGKTVEGRKETIF